MSVIDSNWITRLLLSTRAYSTCESDHGCPRNNMPSINIVHLYWWDIFRYKLHPGLIRAADATSALWLWMITSNSGLFSVQIRMGTSSQLKLQTSRKEILSTYSLLLFRWDLDHMPIEIDRDLLDYRARWKVLTSLLCGAHSLKEGQRTLGWWRPKAILLLNWVCLETLLSEEENVSYRKNHL